jgi:hypothetical protein
MALVFCGHQTDLRLSKSIKRQYLWALWKFFEDSSSRPFHLVVRLFTRQLPIYTRSIRIDTSNTPSSFSSNTRVLISPHSLFLFHFILQPIDTFGKRSRSSATNSTLYVRGLCISLFSSHYSTYRIMYSNWGYLFVNVFVSVHHVKTYRNGSTFYQWTYVAPTWNFVLDQHHKHTHIYVIIKYNINLDNEMIGSNVYLEPKKWRHIVHTLLIRAIIIYRRVQYTVYTYFTEKVDGACRLIINVENASVMRDS